ncbi:MAG: alanine dehydrogenase [Peptococcaceae bacterium]|nr:alanine dehydrogenase [Peptococcaceae bacterium]
MIVGVPKEIKEGETRVALTPPDAGALVKAGHKVLIEKEAGMKSGFTDEEYRKVGAAVVDTAEEVFRTAEMIVKVKEPLPPEYDLFHEGQILFTYLHLAAAPELTEALMAKGVVSIAYETVQLDNGSLPLLLPMSEIAGRMAVQVGARCLENAQGGKGILLGGVPGVPPAHVVIVGGGVVGTNAAKIAHGLGARVTILDINPSRLRYLDDLFGGSVETVMSNEHNVGRYVEDADLLIGAVLIPGAKAPHLVTTEMVRRMKPGSVIVDVAIDQGGCVETIDRTTSHSEPTFVKYDVIHYAVPNIPAAVGKTSTLALTGVTLPYTLQLANKGFEKAVRDNPALMRGINVLEGHITYPPVAEVFNKTYVPVEELLPTA